VSKRELDASLAKTADVALTGQYEPFKTTSLFDGTATNPEWLGEEPKEFRALMPA
jgi:hypothetical protein